MPIRPISIDGRFLEQPLTGVQRYAREITLAIDRVLDPAKDRVELLVSHRAHVDLPLEHIEVRRVGHRRGWRWEQFDLARERVTGILFCPANTFPVTSLLGRRRGRVAVTLHSVSFRKIRSAYRRRFRWAYDRLFRLALKRAEVVLTVSRTEAAALVDAYGDIARRVRPISLGSVPTELERVRAEIEAEPRGDRNYLLYVGSLHDGKNVERMLEAFASVETPAELWIAGGRAKVHGSGNGQTSTGDDRVKWLGEVRDPRELARLYRGARGLVHPSLYESAGLTPLEALAFGCPVAVSDLAALRERCAEAAIYFDPESTASIESAMERLLAENPPRAAAARATVIDWDDTARQTLEALYQTECATA